MKRFIAELVRRKVWLFGGIYLAVAWVLLQVVVLVEGTLSLPEWIDQITLVLLGVGFPVALLLAWAQESQAPKGANEVSSHTEAPVPEKQTHSRLAIAVLPFADMSPEGDQAWFSDGISEEILHRLSAEKELKVAGRTSSFHFRGTTGSFEDIGKTLSVGSVLEGSVRKMDNRVRITAQLIEVASGYHIWSGTFDRELEDIFRIQEDISEAIATALLREIGATPTEQPFVPHEPNVEAFQAFLRGREVWSPYSADGTAEAVEWFKKAAALDKDYFAPAFWLVSLVSYNQGPGGILPKDHYQDLDALVEEALQRNPQPADELNLRVHQAKFNCRFKEAEALLREMQKLPDFEEGWASNPLFLIETGRYEKALEVGTRLLARDPLDPQSTFWQGEYLLANGMFKKIMELVRRSRQLGVSAPGLMTARIFAEGFLADFDSMKRHAYRLISFYGAETGLGLGARLLPAWFEDNKEEVREIREKLIALSGQNDSDASPVDIASCCVMLGEPEEAVTWLRKANEMKHHDIGKAISRPPEWPIRKFLTRDPKGRAFLEEAGYDLTWFPLEEEEAT